MDPPAGQNDIPDSIAQPSIQVITPNGSQTIPNPLYQYTFHPIDPGMMYEPVSLPSATYSLLTRVVPAMAQHPSLADQH
jgi:hypothetical protein